MKKSTENTKESVWATLREISELSKKDREENKKDRKKYREENKAAREEARQEYNEIRALLREAGEQIREAGEQIREVAELQKETDRLQKETDKLQKETDKLQKENAKQQKDNIADYERRMKKQDETIGSWSNNHGTFAEQHFITSFENGKKNFFGEEFDEIKKNLKAAMVGYGDEYDLVLINGKTICIVEVKFRVHKDHISKVLRKAETFRVNFPYFAQHQIFLGVASLVFTPELEQECLDNGIAIIKQSGDLVIINDAHLKAH